MCIFFTPCCYWQDDVCIFGFFFSPPPPSLLWWCQCTKGSDALPGEPREGLSAERAGGPVIQDNPAGRTANGVRGHGAET